MSLTDTSPCPVEGKNLGRPMGNVSLSFLEWLSDQPWALMKYPEVVEFYNAKANEHARQLAQAAAEAEAKPAPQTGDLHATRTL